MAQAPYNPINRRISIVIMNKRTEEALLADGKAVEADSAPEIEKSMLDSQTTRAAVH